jgi:hypothetical protein
VASHRRVFSLIEEIHASYQIFSDFTHGFQMGWSRLPLARFCMVLALTDAQHMRVEGGTSHHVEKDVPARNTVVSAVADWTVDIRGTFSHASGLRISPSETAKP